MLHNVISYFKNGSIIEYDASYITYRQRLKGGRGIAAIYPVMQGVEVILLEFNAQCHCPKVHRNGNMIEIHYCMEGRLECKMGDGFIQYLSEGDLALNSVHSHSETIELPAGLYRGLAFMIDIDVAQTAINMQLPHTDLSLEAIKAKFLTDKENFIIQSREEVQRCLMDMGAVPVPARRDYYRMKTLELLIYLNFFDLSSEKNHTIYAREQVELIRQIQKKLTSSLEQRVTIEELAKEYSISPTSLKAHFKGVFGSSISAYMKEYRIRRAAALLRKTDRSIAEIANMVGYETQSNFGAVFRDIMGESPLAYRKKFEY